MKQTIYIPVLIGLAVILLIAIAFIMNMAGSEAWHLAAPTAWESYDDSSIVRRCRSSEEEKWAIAAIVHHIGAVCIWIGLGTSYKAIIALMKGER